MRRFLAGLCLLLLACECTPATQTTPVVTSSGAEAEPQAAPEPANAELLSEPSTEWTANAAYADLRLPFRMGFTARPCDAVYTVQGYERLVLTYTYEPRRVVITSQVGEMAGQGHEFCLPNPPLVRVQELTPLRMTLDLDEGGRLVAETVEDMGMDPPEPLSEVRFGWEDGRWTSLSYGGAPALPVSYLDPPGQVVGFRAHAGAVDPLFDGEARLIERRVTATDGALEISRYSYEENAPQLVEIQTIRYPDPEGDPESTRTATFTYEGDRLTGCTLGGDEPLTIRYGYDDEGRLVDRSALVINTYEGETNEQEAWAWSYRYDCSEPRETPEDEDYGEE